MANGFNGPIAALSRRHLSLQRFSDDVSFRNEPRIGARLNAAAAGTAYKVKEGSGMEPAADLTGEVGAAAIKDELLEITGERTA